jgi:hypothetical protein
MAQHIVEELALDGSQVGFAIAGQNFGKRLSDLLHQQSVSIEPRPAQLVRESGSNC